MFVLQKKKKTKKTHKTLKEQVFIEQSLLTGLWQAWATASLTALPSAGCPESKGEDGWALPAAWLIHQAHRENVSTSMVAVIAISQVSLFGSSRDTHNLTYQ